MTRPVRVRETHCIRFSEGAESGSARSLARPLICEVSL